MRFTLVNYICGPNGHPFKAPEIVGNSYGEFLLRSAGTGESRYLNALQDKTYDEVDVLLQAEPEVAAMPVTKRAKILRKVFGMAACDRDTSGHPFLIGLHPKCPICGSQEMKSWETTSPPDTVELDIPSVTHHAWASYSAQDKATRVRDCVAQVLVLA